ncbi:2-oxoacid:ferredoxin oxidoreductase subunit beta [bacterium]|nr:2-oxoacid:ferredoxin oxidoreductase subunit beta [bacterium]
MNPKREVIGQTSIRSKVHPVPFAPPRGEGPPPVADEHPLAAYLRMDRIPHIWCPTCGIGIAVKCLAEALDVLQLDTNKVAVVSGIGCTGRVAGYMKLDGFHSTHGRAIPFATGLKLGRPELKVVVFSGDGDLSGIGGNHFIHAARRNMDLMVVLVNNFIYGMTGGQNAPTTPVTAKTSTMPFGNFEHPFNLPALAAGCGADYVARWTTLHVRRLTRSFKEALNRRGFRFIEVIAPCSTLYARLNKLGTGYDLMEFYHNNTEIKNGADPQTVDIGFQGKIICGRFVDSERPTYLDMMKQHYTKVLGDKFVPMPEEGGLIWPPGEKPTTPAAKATAEVREPEEVTHG